MPAAGDKHKECVGVSPQPKRFYQEAHAILDGLAGAAFLNVTHHLLQTLEHFIPVDPRDVFLRIHRVIMGGQQAGYQSDPAADLVVRIVERYLAEYRTIFQEYADCRRDLIEMLDVFVKVGWPNARRLLYRLEDIFR